MQLRTLGGLALDGSDFTRPKPLLLLAYLGLEGPRDRAHLAALFWPEAARPAASLAQALQQLRKGVPKAVAVQRSHLRSAVPSDLEDFLGAFEAGRYQEALELYRGSFLEGLALELSAELEEWVYRSREMLAAKAREALLRLAEHDAAAGRSDPAARRAEEAYLLRGAPEPDADTLQRLHLLFAAAHHPLAAEVEREAASFGVDLATAAAAAAAPAAGYLPPNPYKGLAPFREQDAGNFFGRERATGELLRRLEQPPRVVTVVGPSGSGKSSLVFAGLLPALSGRGRWQVVRCRPGRRPLLALAAALLERLDPELAEAEALQQSERLARGLRTGEASLLQALERLLQRDLDARAVVVIDQLEEVFTTGPGEALEEDTRAFLDQLLALVGGGDGRTAMVLTLRSDFLGAALGYPPMVPLLQASQYLLGPMNEDELRAAVEGPARRAGVDFEEGLAERIVRELAPGEGRLPLLQFLLSALWEKQRSGRLGHGAYEALGGVERALANYAEAVVSGLDEDDREAARHVFLQLVRPFEGQEAARRIATRAELEAHWPLVTRLASARLIVSGRNEQGEETAEVVHEALFRRWETLRRWIEEHRAFRIWQEQLRRDVRLWHASGEDDSALLHGFRLGEARRNLDHYGSHLSMEERAFILAGQALAERQRRERERELLERERLRQLSTLRLQVFLGIALVLLVIAGWQWWQGRVQWTLLRTERDRALEAEAGARAAQQVAEHHADLALARLLGSEALEIVLAPGRRAGYYDRAALLAREAAAIAEESSESLGNLLRVLQNVPLAFERVLPAHRGAVRAVAFAPGGELLATTGEDGLVRLWSLDPGTAAPVWEASEGGGRALAFSPDGALLATAGDDVLVRLRQAADGSEFATLAGNRGAVNALAFSPDGGLLAAAGQDRTVRLWDMSAPDSAAVELAGHRGWVTSLAFDPAGAMLASGGTDRRIVLWDLRSREQLAVLEGHGGAVRAVTFAASGARLYSAGEDGAVLAWQLPQGATEARSDLGSEAFAWGLAPGPDGRLLAAAGEDGLIRLLDAAGLEPAREPLRGHEGSVTAVAFGPREDFLATGGADGSLIFWHLQHRQEAGEPLAGHGLSVRTVAFSPDGTLLASGGLDNTVRLWDVAARAPAGPPLEGHRGWINDVAFSPDGTLLASAGDDHGIVLWDVAEGRPVATLEGHRHFVQAVRFHPGGELLASAGEDRRVLFWDVASGALREPAEQPHSAAVRGLAFSPDGTLLASAGLDDRIVLWDVATATPLEDPIEEDGLFLQRVAFSPDGRFLAGVGLDAGVTLWEVASRKLAAEPLRGHQGWVNDVAFGPDGSTLASAGLDGTIVLWDLPGGRVLGDPLRGHTSAVTSVAFSPDGTLLASASDDTTIRLWDVGPRSWLERACGIAGRNLTPEEWQDYLGERPYRATCTAYPPGG